MKIHQTSLIPFGKLSGAFALAGLLLAQSSPAALLVTDHFNYTDNEGLGLGSSAANWTAGSGTGTGAWTNRASAALSYAGLPAASGIGVKDEVLPTSNRDRGVAFAAQTIDASNPSVYCSFLMRVDVNPGGNKEVAYLRSDTAAGGPVVGIWLDSNNHLGVSKGTSSVGRIGFTTGSVSLGTTTFIVARYHFVDGKDNPGDSVDLWLNPHPGAFSLPEAFIPAPTVSTNWGSARTVAASFILANRATGDGAATCNLAVDELRVGTTWADVTPGVPGVATRLVFTSQPADTLINTTINPVVVQVQDSFGTPVSQSGLPVTIALLAGNGTLAGTLTQNTDGTGKATFSNLSMNHVNAVVVLSGTASGLYDATSGLFAITTVAGTGSPKSPNITQKTRTANTFVLGGNNGDAGQPYDVIATTDISQPRSSWLTVGSGTFDGGGNFSFTDNPGENSRRFYCVKPTGVGSGGGGSEGPSGYATVGGITGGAGGPVRIVNDLAGFSTYAQSADPAIILVRSNISLGLVDADPNFYLGPNKTIIGIGTDVTITGDLAAYGTSGSTQVATPATNLIVRNLIFTNPNSVGEADGFTVKYGANHIWVDHCTFFDCADGTLDVTREGDFVTASWCKFYYSIPAFANHPDVNLIGGSDSDSTDAGKLHVTFHHNWWGMNCRERMPSVRFGRAHVFNNYFNATGNNYCTRTRLNAEVLVENNDYESVQNPWELATSSLGANGLIHCSGNITNNCVFTTNYVANLPNGGVVILVPGTDTLSSGGNELNPPPYAYTLDGAADVSAKVTGNAGAGKGPFAP